MKKMLTLVLILGIASLASAVPVWTITEDAGVVTVSVSGNEGQTVIGLAVDSGGVLSSFTAGPNAPASSSSVAILQEYYPELGTGEIWAMIHITTDTQVYVDGSWLTASFAFAEGMTSATVKLYDTPESGGYTELASLVIPEPITMSLLGLGGLFLRRRK